VGEGDDPDIVAGPDLTAVLMLRGQRKGEQ
jgi:hypothetical protein